MSNDKKEINDVINAMQGLFIEKQYSNSAILNALSTMSVHLAFVFGIPKDVYVKDIEIMFSERIKRAVDEANQVVEEQ